MGRMRDWPSVFIHFLRDQRPIEKGSGKVSCQKYYTYNVRSRPYRKSLPLSTSTHPTPLSRTSIKMWNEPLFNSSLCADQSEGMEAWGVVGCGGPPTNFKIYYNKNDIVKNPDFRKQLKSFKFYICHHPLYAW